jgi:hypothetical protein
MTFYFDDIAVILSLMFLSLRWVCTESGTDYRKVYTLFNLYWSLANLHLQVENLFNK